jgi:hypothetical protein
MFGRYNIVSEDDLRIAGDAKRPKAEPIPG